MRSAVTLSLVSEARGGPFVFWNDLDAAARRAASLGFDGLEVFAPGGQWFASGRLKAVLEQHRLALAAVGTGGGWVLHQLTLTDADPERRQAARQFIAGIMEAGGRLGAPTIIGSMQGRWNENVSRERAIEWLIEALNDLGDRAEALGVPLLFEPLNRYETNLVNTLADGQSLLGSLRTRNVKLLADLYHMNIEEADLPAALRNAGADLGHVHLADSNRRPAGNGHTDFARVAEALRSVRYGGYLSAECLPWPDSDRAAQTTIDALRRHFTTRS